MKKTILYLSLVSTLAVLNTVAMETGGEGENLAAKVARLEGALANMTWERDQSKATQEALREELAVEQAKARELFQQLPPLYIVLNDGVEVGVLSPHQQLLLSRWEKGEIGPSAWAARGG